jgi:hypothetical protein
VTTAGPSQPPEAQGEPGSEHRHERVYIETNRHRIEGLLMVAKEGYRSRVSDVLNASERDFLTLTDATVETLDGDSRPRRFAFLAVARRHIVLAVSASEPDGPDPG